jgi:hypothetical protein
MSDRSHLLRQICSHDVDTVSQVLSLSVYICDLDGITHFPCTGDSRDHGLTTESTIRSDLSSDSSDFGRETSQTVHHPVDCTLANQFLSQMYCRCDSP